MEASLYQDGEPDKAQDLKKNMFLDFTSGNTKQQKFANLLASPDFKMLNMSSPELEKMFTSNGVLQTPTPTQFIYPKYVTDEQEAYARGFVEALAQLHGPGGVPSTGPTATATTLPNALNSTQTGVPSQTADLPTYSQLKPMSTIAFTAASTSAATTLANMSALGSIPSSKRPYQFVPSGLVTPSKPSSTIPSSVEVKHEPAASCSSETDHTVPTSMQASPAGSSRVTDSPALSPSSTVNMDNDAMPIDMDNQEVIKVERKRARNRIAARKCRTRKLERISRLEEKVNDLKNKNTELLQHATSLNDQVVQLKQQIMDHMKTGCQILMPNTSVLGPT